MGKVISLESLYHHFEIETYQLQGFITLLNIGYLSPLGKNVIEA